MLKSQKGAKSVNFVWTDYYSCVLLGFISFVCLKFELI